MDNQKLIEIAKLSETSERVLKMVADRRRNTIYTAFSGLRADLKKRDGKPVDRVDFDRTFLELQKIGAGKMKVTKRGICLGFNWEIPIRDVGMAFKEDQTIPNGRKEVKKLTEKVVLVLIRSDKKPQTVEIDEERLTKLLA